MASINPAPGGVPPKNAVSTQIPLVDPSTDSIGTVASRVGANAANTLLYISGGITIIYLLFTSVQLITAAGDQGKIDSAKRHLVNALVGAAIITLSIFIVRLIYSSLANGITPS